MSGENPVTIDVYILDKTFKVACPEDEREDLLASARMLSDRMREIKAAGKMMSADRIAIMAGLNIAHDLLKSQKGSGSGDPNLDARLASLATRVSEVLNNAD